MDSDRHRTGSAPRDLPSPSLCPVLVPALRSCFLPSITEASRTSVFSVLLQRVSGLRSPMPRLSDPAAHRRGIHRKVETLHCTRHPGPPRGPGSPDHAHTKASYSLDAPLARLSEDCETRHRLHAALSGRKSAEAQRSTFPSSSAQKGPVTQTPSKTTPKSLQGLKLTSGPSSLLKRIWF